MLKDLQVSIQLSLVADNGETNHHLCMLRDNSEANHYIQFRETIGRLIITFYIHHNRTSIGAFKYSIRKYSEAHQQKKAVDATSCNLPVHPAHENDNKESKRKGAWKKEMTSLH